jgi:hypothetical protein
MTWFEMLPPPVELWTVYERPNPLQYVAKLTLIDGDGVHPTDRLRVSSYLETIRAELLARGLQCLKRDPEDDPSIVELWL